MAHCTTERFYDDVAAAIAGQLEKGVVPWVRPWTSLASHKNGYSGRPYNGVNGLLLDITALVCGYSSQAWLTWENVKALGGRVNWGEEKRYTLVLWWRPSRSFAKDENGHIVRDEETGEPLEKVRWLSGVHRVYNLEQTNVAPEKVAKFFNLDARPEGERNADCDAFVAALCAGAKVSYGGDRACYSPSADSIRIPPFEAFKLVNEWYATHFHEFAHWTGHKSRCSRQVANSHGSSEYAREELVAELTAALVGAEHQVDGGCQHAEYIGNWAKLLRGEKARDLVAAVSSQSKAAARFLNTEAAKNGYKAPEAEKPEAEQKKAA